MSFQKKHMSATDTEVTIAEIFEEINGTVLQLEVSVQNLHDVLHHNKRKAPEPEEEEEDAATTYYDGSETEDELDEPIKRQCSSSSFDFGAC